MAHAGRIGVQPSSLTSYFPRSSFPLYWSPFHRPDSQWTYIGPWLARERRHSISDRSLHDNATVVAPFIFPQTPRPAPQPSTFHTPAVAFHPRPTALPSCKVSWLPAIYIQCLCCSVMLFECVLGCNRSTCRPLVSLCLTPLTLVSVEKN